MRQRKMQGRKTHRSVIHILWIVPWSAWRHFSKRIKSSTPSSKTELKEILLRDLPIVPRTDNPRKTWRKKFFVIESKTFYSHDIKMSFITQIYVQFLLASHRVDLYISLCFEMTNVMTNVICHGKWQITNIFDVSKLQIWRKKHSS